MFCRFKSGIVGTILLAKDEFSGVQSSSNVTRDAVCCEIAIV